MESCNNILSIIIPVYNAEKFISSTINSILVQQFTNVEVVIIDDGSTDQSATIIDGFANNHDNVLAIHISNQGVSNARNEGIKIATGDYIYFMDADDRIEEGFFDRIEGFSNYDLYIFGAWFDFLNSKRIAKYADEAELLSKKKIGEYFVRMTMDSESMMLNYVWNRIYKKKIIQKNNIHFDEKISLGEDFVFNVQYLKYCNSIKIIEEPLYHYYIRGNGSLVSKFDINESKRRKIMQNAFCELANEYEIYEDIFPLFYEIEGINCIISIRKVTNHNCTLRSKADKYKYIDSFLNRENLIYINYYMNKKRNLYRIITRNIINLKRPNIIYMYFSIIKRLEKILFYRK